MTASWESLVPAVLLTCCLASSWWGMRRFFTRPGGLTASMRLIAGCATVFGILHLYAILSGSNRTAERSVAGSALYILSVGLFWWAIKTSLGKPLSAAFSPDTPAHLVRSGPYRFVRHPLYTSYILTWLAGWVVTVQWWLIPTVLIMTVIYFVASSAEEQKFLRSPLADAYQQYRFRTGRFLPNLFKLLAAVPAPTGPQTSEPRA
ncbi:MAG TPA: isoprenylcysteine carboxylmethyltransferase family protein [Bryobacteraceae bacterium]|nr:isoprenylcysteine carboxylmethyltransferase family protein [Bryobacteraceae bacterium]